jgi:hypothetical protein
MRRSRLLYVCVALGILGVLTAAIVLFWFLPGYVERRARSEAERHGVIIEGGRFSFGLHWVQIEKPRLKLVGVRSIVANVGIIDVGIADFKPQGIELRGVEALVVGSVANVALELSRWTKTYPHAYQLPVSARNLHVQFREQTDTPSWLDVNEGTLTHTQVGATFIANKTTLLGANLGRIGAGWAAGATSGNGASGVALGFGEQDLGKAPIKLEVRPDAKPFAIAQITVAPTPLERFSKPFKVELPLKDVTVSGNVVLNFPPGELNGKVTGTTHMELKGYVPPHPVELTGFIFGDTTVFDTKLDISADHQQVLLRESKVRAGKFELQGEGSIVRQPEFSRILMEMKGNLPCSALAGAAVEARFGKLLGQFTPAASATARHSVEGSVGVVVKVDADSRNLPGARVEKRIGVGCGLRPLSIKELEDIARRLPPELRDLATQAVEMGAQLPPLPSGLPTLPAPGKLPPIPSGLPKLPEFKIEFGSDKEKAPATKKATQGAAGTSGN